MAHSPWPHLKLMKCAISQIRRVNILHLAGTAIDHGPWKIDLYGPVHIKLLQVVGYPPYKASAQGTVDDAVVI